jgi:hypothetical protein
MGALPPPAWSGRGFVASSSAAANVVDAASPPIHRVALDRIAVSLLQGADGHTR